MKIFITWTAGFIGFYLSKKLLENNFSVFGIDNLNNYYDTELKKNRLKEKTHNVLQTLFLKKREKPCCKNTKN